MKNFHKGFALPLLLAIIAILFAGGGAYVYVHNNRASKSVSESPMTLATSTNETQNSQTQINDALGDFYPIQRFPAVNDRFNAIRYSCQDKKLISEIEKDSSGEFQYILATSITILPGDIALKKIDPTAKFVSYTFDKECKNVYAIVQYASGGKKDIFKFDVENGAYTKLTNNLSPRWTTPRESKPDAIFIYAISDTKLLVSFFEVTTGLDAYTNFTTQKIFDVASGKFTKDISFVDDSSSAYLLPPTILNFRTNILSNAVEIDQQADGGYGRLVRKDFDLISGKFTATKDLNPELLKGENQLSELSFACPDRKGESEAYDMCIKENLRNIFPELR